MADMKSVDVVIIGGGPGGYVAAIRAAQLGLNTVCVEMDKTLGGTCVNVGCIPSKALLTSSEHYEWARLHAAEHGVRIEGVSADLPTMLKRKDAVVLQNTKGIEFLFRKNKVEWAKGRGTLKAGNVVDVAAADGTTTSYQAKNVIIATGSVPIELPFLKFDEERVLSNIGALKIPEVPKHLIVIGGGVIGLELGSVWRRLGARVTVVELFPTILPGNDEEIIKEADRIFRKQGLEIRAGTKVVGAKRDGNVVNVDIEKDGQKETLEADYVLVSVGRKSSLSGIDAAALGLNVGKRGEIVVDAQMRTNLPNVYAIGDATGGKLLAHKAEEEGVV
ncbi:MAG TPA: FAD-dependent oxidoreductase, partial [Gemmatimonadaceae bacterium]|nr:FAD-dependent oxidoreductase [Gemmatimonadaceae bacterium]